MSAFENLAGGFAILSWETLPVIALGVLCGVIFGLLPGLTATLAVAILAPFTFDLDALVAIPFLIGVYRGGLHGGAITGILIGVPGTPANVPTLMDGYALTQRGYPLTALRTALYSSVFGSFLSAVLLVTVIEQVARLALRIGSPQLFALLVLSMTLVSFISGDDLAKGLFSATLGIMVGVVGLDPVTGTARFTFGSSAMLSGFPIIPVFIGLFAISEMSAVIERFAATGGARSKAAASLQSREDDNIRFLDVVRRYWRTILTGSGIGAFIGLLPGVGSETSPWVSYGVTKRFSKRRNQLGSGEPEGIVAAESANDAVASSAFVPTLIFGIPGDLPLAVLTGALVVHGLRPGPQLFRDNPDAIFGIVLSVLVSSILLLIVVRPLTPLLSKVVRLPAAVLVPSISGLCIAGAFAINNEPVDLYILCAFGFIGIAMRLTKTPFAPFVLAFILGPMLESAFRESLMLRRGYGIFLESPFSVVVLGAALLIGLGAVYTAATRRQREHSL